MATEEKRAHQTGPIIDGLEAQNVVSIKDKLDADVMVDGHKWTEAWDEVVNAKPWTEKEYDVYGQFIAPHADQGSFGKPTDAERMATATRVLRDKAHEVELKNEWWSGCIAGVVMFTAVLILSVIVKDLL